ncbi:MAG: hypothetical protein ACO3S0_16185 [bacterium]
MSAGKGALPRPVNLQVYRKNYERIFQRTTDRPEDLPIPIQETTTDERTTTSQQDDKPAPGSR